MKTTFILLIVAVFVAGGVGFFIGRGNAPGNDSNAPRKVKVSEEVKVTPDSLAVSEGANTNTSTNTNTPTAAVESSEPRPATPAPLPTPAPTPPSTENPSPPPTTTAARGGTVLERIDIGKSDYALSVILESISKNMSAKKLAYDSKKKQDCSGIYHQLKDSLQARIPKLANPDKYKFPAFENDRITRQIADWYYRNGNLLLVEDPIASRNSIRPGSVMFFSKPGKKYSNIDIDMLTNRQNGYTDKGAIMHVAVVTTVMTDENGDVEQYTMMHGRNKDVHASLSGSGIIQSTNTPGLPPFGNHSQQWVAVANIVTPK